MCEHTNIQPLADEWMEKFQPTDTQENLPAGKHTRQKWFKHTKMTQDDSDHHHKHKHICGAQSLHFVPVIERRVVSAWITYVSCYTFMVNNILTNILKKETSHL